MDQPEQEVATFQSTYGGTGGKEALAAEVRTKYITALKGIQEELRDYWLNHAFLRGHQWLYADTRSGQLEAIPRDPTRVQATVNRLAPNTRTIISTLMQRELAFEVPPAAADDSHVRGARISETIARAVHHDHNWENMRERLYAAVWTGGTAAVCVDWDPDAGDILADDTQGSPLREGTTYEECLNITEFVVEPGSRDPERARWWIKAVTLPPKVVQGKFGLEKEPPADATAGLSMFQKRMTAVDRGAADHNIRLTSVLTYYERPNPDCEKGKVVVVVDNQVVFEDEWPFPFTDCLNLVVARETVRDNRWTGDTVLTAARPLQTLLNVSWSSIAEHMKLAGNARLLVPASSIDFMKSATDLPGEMIPFNDGANIKPDYLSPPQMPSWWIDQPRRIIEQIDDITGVHDISRGAAPANIESGFGLTILAEQDATPLSRLTRETSHVFGRLMTLVLKIYEDKTKGTQIKRRSLVRIPGNAPLDVLWNGEDLKGQTTAIVPLDAILPRSRAAQMDIAKDMLAAGLIQSLEDFIAVADLPGARDVLVVTSPDVDRARRENSQFGLGRQSIPYPWDDHRVHIHEHNKYRKTVDFELLDDEEKQMIEDHIKAHETLAAEETGKARLRTETDPALGAAPTAEEGPIVAPLELPPAQGPAAMPGAMPTALDEGPNLNNGLPVAAQEAIEGGFGEGPTPEQAASDIRSLLQQLGG